MASFESLSSELISQIVSYLPPGNKSSYKYPRWTKKPKSILAPFATISRQFRNAVERRTFENVILESSELDQGLIQERHANLISELTFNIVLPNYSDNACGRFESNKDIHLNNAAFTRAMKSLFRLIKLWETDPFSSRTRPLSLVLGSVHSPMDRLYRGSQKCKNDKPGQRMRKRHDLFERRYGYSVLCLLDHHFSSFPELFCVTEFKEDVFAAGRGERILRSNELVFIASRMPHLQSTSWHIADNQTWLGEARWENRMEFAQCLSSLNQKTLKDVRLNMEVDTPTNHDFTPSPNHTNPDQLSIGLRRWI